LTFITGPVRSGKSRFAERLAEQTGLPVTYIATARPYPDDLEWAARLARHAARRPRTWNVIETAASPVPLVDILGEMEPASCAVVDSLGTWIADRMGDSGAFDARALEKECDWLADALCSAAARLVVVSEEVGWGIVPAHPSARVFRDLLGRMHQRLAREASEAYLVVSGFALSLRIGEPV